MSQFDGVCLQVVMIGLGKCNTILIITEYWGGA